MGTHKGTQHDLANEHKRNVLFHNCRTQCTALCPITIPSVQAAFWLGDEAKQGTPFLYFIRLLQFSPCWCQKQSHPRKNWTASDSTSSNPCGSYNIRIHVVKKIKHQQSHFVRQEFHEIASTCFAWDEIQCESINEVFPQWSHTRESHQLATVVSESKCLSRPHGKVQQRTRKRRPLFESRLYIVNNFKSWWMGEVEGSPCGRVNVQEFRESKCAWQDRAVWTGQFLQS